MQHDISILSSKRKVKIRSSKGKRISLNIQRVECSVYNELGFKSQHYMIEDINASCMCFLFTTKNGKPFAFVAVINQTYRGCRNGMRISRIVIAPKFQGKGYSVALTSLMGGLLTAKGKLMYINTHKENYGRALGRSRCFKSTAADMRDRRNTTDGKCKNRQNGKAYRKKYIGRAIYGYKDLFCDIDTMRAKAFTMATEKDADTVSNAVKTCKFTFYDLADSVTHTSLPQWGHTNVGNGDSCLLLKPMNKSGTSQPITSAIFISVRILRLSGLLTCL